MRIGHIFVKILAKLQGEKKDDYQLSLLDREETQIGEVILVKNGKQLTLAVEIYKFYTHTHGNNRVGTFFFICEFYELALCQLIFHLSVQIEELWEGSYG